MWPWSKKTYVRARDRVLEDDILRTPVDRHQERFRLRLGLGLLVLAGVAALLGLWL